jgi:hypothetical protein
MHAALAMASAHLRHLGAPLEQTPNQERFHLSYAIAGLRKELSCLVEQKMIQPIFFSALLLFHHSWAFVEPDQDPHASFDNDQFYILGLGLSAVVERYVRPDKSFLRKWRPGTSLEPIKDYLEQKNLPAVANSPFIQSFSMSSLLDVDDESVSAYVDAEQKLAPLFSVIRGGSSQDLAGMSAELARFLFTWPMRCRDELVQLCRGNKQAGKILLLNYYMTTSHLIGEKFWWVEERTKHFCNLWRNERFDSYLF